MSEKTSYLIQRNSAGRPCNYTPDIPERLVDFFDRDPEEFITHNFTSTGKSNYRVLPVPTMAAFARELGIGKNVIYSWMDEGSLLVPEERARLRGAYSRAKALQENIILQIGLMTNSTFATFMLKCNFGWRDNTEVKSEEQSKTIRLKIVTERPVEVEDESGSGESVEWGDD